MKIAPLIIAFSLFNVFSFAIPSPGLLGKGTLRATCNNAPAVIAGTVSNAFPPRVHSTDLIPRKPFEGAIRWCVPDSSIYLELSFQRVIHGAAVAVLCRAASHYVIHTLHEYGNKPVVSGFFNFRGPDGLLLHMATAAEGTLTWAHMDTAITTLTNYLIQHQFGTVSFKIFSGTTQVGQGSIMDANAR